MVVQRIEVPVPVDDNAGELVRMQIAAILGVVVAARVTVVRLRRHYRSEGGTPAAGGIIDLGGVATPVPPVTGRARAPGR